MIGLPADGPVSAVNSPAAWLHIRCRDTETCDECRGRDDDHHRQVQGGRAGNDAGGTDGL